MFVVPLRGIIFHTHLSHIFNSSNKNVKTTKIRANHLQYSSPTIIQVEAALPTIKLFYGQIIVSNLRNQIVIANLCGLQNKENLHWKAKNHVYCHFNTCYSASFGRPVASGCSQQSLVGCIGWLQKIWFLFSSDSVQMQTQGLVGPLIRVVYFKFSF